MKTYKVSAFNSTATTAACSVPLSPPNEVKTSNIQWVFLKPGTTPAQSFRSNMTSEQKHRDNEYTSILSRKSKPADRFLRAIHVDDLEFDFENVCKSYYRSVSPSDMNLETSLHKFKQSASVGRKKKIHYKTPCYTISTEGWMLNDPVHQFAASFGHSTTSASNRKEHRQLCSLQNNLNNKIELIETKEKKLKQTRAKDYGSNIFEVERLVGKCIETHNSGSFNLDTSWSSGSQKDRSLMNKKLIDSANETREDPEFRGGTDVSFNRMGIRESNIPMQALYNKEVEAIKKYEKDKGALRHAPLNITYVNEEVMKEISFRLKQTKEKHPLKENENNKSVRIQAIDSQNIIDIPLSSTKKNTNSNIMSLKRAMPQSERHQVLNNSLHDFIHGKTSRRRMIQHDEIQTRFEIILPYLLNRAHSDKLEDKLAEITLEIPKPEISKLDLENPEQRTKKPPLKNKTAMYGKWYLKPGDFTYPIKGLFNSKGKRVPKNAHSLLEKLLKINTGNKNPEEENLCPRDLSNNKAPAKRTVSSFVKEEIYS